MKRQRRSVTLTWFGHSAFSIRTPHDRSILIDPWLSNPSAPAGIAGTIAADLILLTHAHGDHLGDAVAIAKRTGAPVIAIYELALYLGQKGLTTVQMNKGATLTRDGVSITMTDARHSSVIEENGVMLPAGEAAGFIIAVENGPTVYHAGDTTVFSDMALIGKLYRPGVVLLPVGDLFTMGPAEAALACTLLKPKTIIGMHYGTFPALTGTPAGLKKCLPPALRNRVLELKPGEPVLLR